VILLSGGAVTIQPLSGTQTLRSGGGLTLLTRRPDQTPTTNPARCNPTLATPATAEPPEAAADGTDITQWIGPTADATIQVELGQTVPLGSVTITRNPGTTFASTSGGKGGAMAPRAPASGWRRRWTGPAGGWSPR